MSWQAERILFAYSSTNLITFLTRSILPLHTGEEQQTFPQEQSGPAVLQIQRSWVNKQHSSILSFAPSYIIRRRQQFAVAPKGGALCGDPVLVNHINLRTLSSSLLSTHFQIWKSWKSGALIRQPRCQTSTLCTSTSKPASFRTFLKPSTV